MSIKIISVLSVILILFLSNPLQGQQSTTTFFANYEGVGYTGSGFTKNMKLSIVTVGSTHKENFKVENNAGVVGKNGLYKISVFCGVTGGDISSQGLQYAIYVNNNLVSSTNPSSIPATGIYEIQRNLNQGDIIVVKVTKNFNFPNDTGNNKVDLKKIN